MTSQNSPPGGDGQASIAALRRFVRPRPPAERCELCGVELGPEHQHLLDLASRQLQCACDACALLFSSQSEQKFRRVPKRARFLPDFQLNDDTWDSLLIPVGMAFFFHNSQAGKVTALYPSPAGVIESLLTLESWAEIVEQNPVLNELEADVEALLVNRVKGVGGLGGAATSQGEYYLVSIDRCYELAGLIRTRWRGLSGGQEVWEEIAQFFTRLKSQAVGAVGVRSIRGEKPRA
jgi:hypothetical protein